MQIAFYILALVSVLSAIGVIVSRSPVYSVLSLIVTFFTIAGQFILLNAQFLAAVHIIVYAGDIMVLFLFLIMLLNLNKEQSQFVKTPTMLYAGAFSGGLLFLVLMAAVRGAALPPQVASGEALTNAQLQIGMVDRLGITLFSNYMLPFELSSLLFLSAMIGAVMLAKKEAA
jgi:NADH-quinone oxidoreductase subunit J